MKRVLVINGPNLNLLGNRNPDIYGSTTLNELEALIGGWAEERSVKVTCFQSNHEGAIIDRLHDSRHAHDGVIINAGALTHYSYALHDAIAAVDLPTVEVHISNIKEREEWRHTSVISAACQYMIRGRGVDGYRYALDYLINRATAAPLTIAYGSSEDQVGDLLVPAGEGPHPVVALIHGGFWRDRWTRDTMASLALDLVDRGWATWNLEYRRVGTGGGWPLTFEDVAAGLDHLAELASDHSLDLGRIAAIGHSAGGHLALWAAGRPHLADHIADAEPRVSLVAAIGLAPVSDLEAGYAQAIGNEAVAGFMGRSPGESPERYASGSPQKLLPLGTRQIILHGTEDTAVPVSMSRSFVAAARSAGDDIVYHELDGVDHMSLIAADQPAWQTVVAELDKLR